MLTIMKDSRIGSYGSAGLTLMLLGKALALIELANIDLTLALVALLVAHPLSRLASTSLIHFLDYVREDEAPSPGRWRGACRHTSSPSRCRAAHCPCCCCPRCRRSEPSRWRHWSPGAPRGVSAPPRRLYRRLPRRGPAGERAGLLFRHTRGMELHLIRHPRPAVAPALATAGPICRCSSHRTNWLPP